MKYVFGPVPSRRLGKSLGIDPIPLKTCNWNCVYCQLGQTHPFAVERREYVPRSEILDEVQNTLASHPQGDIDWVTFVGSGETTLYKGLGWLVEEIHKLSELPVAVIINGSLLSSQEVRDELLSTQAVLPTLDAGSDRLFRRINRPSPYFNFSRHVEGLKTFRKVFSGKLWLEVMLIKGLNDSDESLREIASIIHEISPDQVHLVLPTRPPSESWVEPPDEAGLQRAREILSEVARVIQPEQSGAAASVSDDLDTAILGIVTRHPMSEIELCGVLGGYSRPEVGSALKRLQQASRIQEVVRFHTSFWSAAGASYKEQHSPARGQV